MLDDNGDVVVISMSGVFSEAEGPLTKNFVIPVDDALEKLELQLGKHPQELLRNRSKLLTSFGLTTE